MFLYLLLLDSFWIDFIFWWNYSVLFIKLDTFLNTYGILDEITVSFIVHFCLGKYCFSLDTFLNGTSYFEEN